MSHNLKISVIIPTFNRGHTISRALNSVTSQVYEAYEIVVVDDGSTDNTRSIIQSQFPQVNYYFQTNSGVSAARNYGIQQAKGNWIALLDSDDEWLPDKLLRQYQAIMTHPEYRLCHTEEIWVRNGKRVNAKNKHQKFGGFIYEKCLPLCAISPSSTLMEKALLCELGLFNEDLIACEDYDLWLRHCSKYPVLFIEQSLIIKYGGHSDQLSQQHWGMDRFRIIALQNMLKSHSLNDKQYSLTTQMLHHKCDILINGATKRQNLDLVTQYEQIKLQFPLA